MFSNIFGTRKKDEHSGPIENETINQVVTELKKQPQFKNVKVTKNVDVQCSVQGSHELVFTIKFDLNGFDSVSILHGMTSQEPHSIDFEGDRKNPKDIVKYILTEALDFAYTEKSHSSFMDTKVVEELRKLKSLYE